MRDVYIYMGRDNRVPVKLHSELTTGEEATDPPLQGATKVVLELADGTEFDSTTDPEIEIVDSSTISLWLGVALDELTAGEPITGQLSVFYTDRPNGVAWPGSTESPNLPTFRFIPVDWRDKP